jgi:O-succinylbenzoic acid--CoA ligase
MLVPSIITPHAAYPLEQITQAGSAVLKEADKIFAQTFDLAQQWLSGAQSFTFHTSGSTGTPKPVTLTRQQLEASATGTIRALGLTQHEHILLCMNTAFIGGAMLLIRGLLLGATITVQEPSGHPLEHIAADHPYTFTSFTPVQLHALRSNDAGLTAKLNRFTHILVGGAAISFALEQKLSMLTARVYHTYGMTETVSHIALKQIGKDAAFKALPDVKLKTDERGCLMISSASTNHAWITTNDVVEMTGNDMFTILGRADDIINTGGIKVWPLKIEQALLEALYTLELERNLFVSWVPDEKLGQKVIAVIEGNPLTAQQEQAITEQLMHRLTRYEIPKTFYYLLAFILTGTGKINKPKSMEMIHLSN